MGKANKTDRPVNAAQIGSNRRCPYQTNRMTGRFVISFHSQGAKTAPHLAIYMRDRMPGLEYVFCDTGEELPETYEYLDKLEVYLGAPIARLNPDGPSVITSRSITAYCRMPERAGARAN